MKIRPKNNLALLTHFESKTENKNGYELLNDTPNNIRGSDLPQKQNLEMKTYFLRCSAKELLLVWANMSKSSWLRPGREDRVPLTLSEAISGEGDSERGEQKMKKCSNLHSFLIHHCSAASKINDNSNISKI